MKPGRMFFDFYLKVHIKEHQFASGIASVHKQVCEKFMFEFFEFMPLRIVNIKWLFGFLLLEILNNIHNKRVGN